jgi:hypothetical protein
MLNKGIDEGTKKLNEKVPGASEKIDDVKKKLPDELPGGIKNPFGK